MQAVIPGPGTLQATKRLAWIQHSRLNLAACNIPVSCVTACTCDSTDCMVSPSITTGVTGSIRTTRTGSSESRSWQCFTASGMLRVRGTCSSDWKHVEEYARLELCRVAFCGGVSSRVFFHLSHIQMYLLVISRLDRKLARRESHNC